MAPWRGSRGPGPAAPAVFPMTNDFQRMLHRIGLSPDAACETVMIAEGIENMTELGRIMETKDLAARHCNDPGDKLKEEPWTGQSLW